MHVMQIKYRKLAILPTPHHRPRPILDHVEPFDHQFKLDQQSKPGGNDSTITLHTLQTYSWLVNLPPLTYPPQK